VVATSPDLIQNTYDTSAYLHSTETLFILRWSQGSSIKEISLVIYANNYCCIVQGSEPKHLETQSTLQVQTWMRDDKKIKQLISQLAKITVPAIQQENVELHFMQQTFKSIKNWNHLQPRCEMEWLTITRDFFKEVQNMRSRQKLQPIMTLIRFHREAKNMALVKL